jgi:hypothetical protein
VPTVRTPGCWLPRSGRGDQRHPPAVDSHGRDARQEQSLDTRVDRAVTRHRSPHPSGGTGRGSGRRSPCPHIRLELDDTHTEAAPPTGLSSANGCRVPHGPALTYRTDGRFATLSAAAKAAHTDLDSPR